MAKYRYLANNIALFSISNFVSKILVFLLVPFYTNVLSTADYGIADVFQTTLLLLVPALTINMGEAALRFGIENAKQRGLILRIGLKYVLRASLFVIAGAVVAAFFLPLRLVILFVILFFTNAVYEFLILYFQGCELVKVVVVGSVFSTVLLICSNLLFLLVWKLGLTGYLVSQMIAYAGAAGLMLTLAGKLHKEIFLQMGQKKEFEKELLAYGKPMILYSTGAWINNAADRYFVSALCGLAVNGLYGVAYKIPSILTVFQRIFAQAWQMSATKERPMESSQQTADNALAKEENPQPEAAQNENQRDVKNSREIKQSGFYSNMYRFYFSFMVLGCSFLILIVRPLAFFLFRKDFFEAWRFVPPLLISVVFGAMTGFLGSICLAYKDSKAMGLATGIGAAVNVILNALLIPGLSAMGAAIATAVSYFVMYAMAFWFVRKYIRLEVDMARGLLAVLLLVIEAVVMVNGAGDAVTYVICGGSFLVLLAIYLKWIKEIVGILIDRIKKIKN